jgi:hypothetical protein
MDECGVYIQPINYPTVPRGAERLRITPSPLHSDADIDHLLASIDAIWTSVGAPREAPMNANHPLAQLCPVVGPLKMDPADLGVDSCPWVGADRPEANEPAAVEAVESVASETVSA